MPASPRTLVTVFSTPGRSVLLKKMRSPFGLTSTPKPSKSTSRGSLPLKTEAEMERGPSAAVSKTTVTRFVKMSLLGLSRVTTSMPSCSARTPALT